MSGLVFGFAATVAALLVFFVLTVLQLRRVTGASEPIDVRDDGEEAERDEDRDEASDTA